MDLFVGLGIVFLIASAYMLMDTVFILKQCKASTTGTLVEIDVRSDPQRYNAGKMCYVPVYSYEVNGKTYKNAAKVYKNSPEELEIGSTAEIKYCEANPDICIIGKRNGKFGCAIVFLVFAIIMFALGFK